MAKYKAFSALILIVVAIRTEAQITRPSAPAWNRIHNFVYQLQNIDIKAIGKTKFDLAVIDYSADGSDATRFSKLQIESLQTDPVHPKRVLAYLSIGEAEDYRYYWQSSWKKSPPDFVGPVDPDWPGNYKVKFWDPAWQKIVFEYEDKIIDAGFDGVYLDVIDAYEFWRDKGHANSEQEMVDFVRAIATHARDVRGVKNFAVFVQNAEELSSHKDYVDTVTGIGREDLFFDGNSKVAPEETKFAISKLNAFKDAGKLVLVIDYPTDQVKIDEVYSRAAAHGFVPYVARRQLDQLTINKGHAPE
jgi:cysteinyl-tRNA synthetase